MKHYECTRDMIIDGVIYRSVNGIVTTPEEDDTPTNLPVNSGNILGQTVSAESIPEYVEVVIDTSPASHVRRGRKPERSV